MCADALSPTIKEETGYNETGMQYSNIAISNTCTPIACACIDVPGNLKQLPHNYGPPTRIVKGHCL